MKILVLLKEGDFLCGSYKDAINHHEDTVVYMGSQEALKEIDDVLPCQKIALENRLCFEEARAKISTLPFVPDHLVATKESDLLFAARLRECFHIRGAKEQDVQKVVDKIVMKNLVKEYGVRIPHHISLSHLINLSREEVAHLFPDQKVILKPIKGAGSFDTCVYENVLMLYDAVSSSKTGIKSLDVDNDFDIFEVESFIEGAIFHVDGIVQKGRILRSIASQYVGTCYDFGRYGKPFGSFHIEMTPDIMATTEKVIKALQIGDADKGGAVFHLELIMSSHGLYFLEIANRCGGGGIVERFNRATGLSLRAVEIRSLLGENIVYALEKVDGTYNGDDMYGEFLFPCHHLNVQVGESVMCHNVDRYKNNSLVIKWEENRIKKLSHSSYKTSNNAIGGLLKGSPEEMKVFLTHMFQDVYVAMC